MSGDTLKRGAAAARHDPAARPAPMPQWPPPLGAEFLEQAAALLADPGQGESGPRAMAPMKQKRAFEAAFAALCKRRHAIAVNSGTTALDLAVEAFDAPADAVVVAANYGHPATIQRAARRHRLRLIDIDPASLCMDPEALAAALAPGDVGMVLVTHVAGNGGRIDEIAALCARQSVPLIEDASHAHGAMHRGRPLGSYGQIGCFSLHATKNLSCGEGGILCLDDEQLYTRIWRLHDIGRDPDAAPYAFETLGGNYRLSELAALEGRHRLRALPRQVEVRNANARRLSDALGQSHCLLPLSNADPGPAGWHFFPAWYRPEFCGGLSRTRFVPAMHAGGAPCYAGWPTPLSRMKPFAALAEDIPTPQAERACAEQVWLDGRLLLMDDGVERVLSALTRAAARRRGR